MGSFVTSCMHRQLVDWDSSFPSINKNCHFKTVFCIYLFDDLNPVSVPNMWKEERNQQGANTFSQHCIGNKRVNIGRLDNTGRKKIVHRNSKTLCLAYFNTLIKNCASLMWLKLLNQNFKTFSQDKNAKTNLNSFKCIQFPRNLDIFPTNSNDRNPACKERLNYFFYQYTKVTYMTDVSGNFGRWSSGKGSAPLLSMCVFTVYALTTASPSSTDLWMIPSLACS